MHVKEHPAYFHRFDVVWTPTVLVLGPDGKERWRIEGYLPKDEFRAQLELGLARVAFVQKQWGEAERRYGEVLAHHPRSSAAPEALYWQGVTRYSASRDHTVLGALAREFKDRYPESVWALKTVAWAE